MSEEENEKILKEDFEFLNEKKVEKIMAEVISDFGKRKINFDVLLKKINLLKLLFDKEQKSKENLSLKLNSIYLIMENDKSIKKNEFKRPRNLNEKELEDLRIFENNSKRRNISIPTFEIPNFRISNGKDLIFASKNTTAFCDYTEDVIKFMNNEPKKQIFQGEIIENENDYFFGSSMENTINPENLKKLNEDNSTKNKLSKQFIELNKCSFEELEKINKAPYQPGIKNKKLYLKNVHPKVFIKF